MESIGLFFRTQTSEMQHIWFGIPILLQLSCLPSACLNDSTEREAYLYNRERELAMELALSHKTSDSKLLQSSSFHSCFSRIKRSENLPCGLHG